MTSLAADDTAALSRLRQGPLSAGELTAAGLAQIAPAIATFFVLGGIVSASGLAAEHARAEGGRIPHAAAQRAPRHLRGHRRRSRPGSVLADEDPDGLAASPGTTVPVPVPEVAM